MKFLVRVLNSGAQKSFGGIAQLVERLVRNEKARGSNPLTSSLRSRRRRERDCRAEALAKADIFWVRYMNAASYDSASQGLEWQNSFTFTFFKVMWIRNGSIQA